MAFFSAKPARGTWFFFGAVVLGLLGVRGWNRNEARIDHRDGPASETASGLAGCLLGGHTGWILQNPDSPTAAADWGQLTNEWLKSAVNGTDGDNWPSRCASYAIDLAQRLDRVPEATSTSALAREFATTLEGAGRDRLRFVAEVDAGRVGTPFGRLMAETYALSTGTRSHWTMLGGQPLPPYAEIPRFRAQGPSDERVTLAGVEGLLRWVPSRGETQLLRWERTALAPRRLGSWVPWEHGRAGDVVFGETDEGTMVATLGPQLRSYPLPEGLYPEGVRSESGWEAAQSGVHLAMMLRDAGSLRVSVTATDGPTQWSPPLTVGTASTYLAATIAPMRAGAEPGTLIPGSEGWRVTVLRPLVETAVVEQFRIAPSTAGEGGAVRWSVSGLELPVAEDGSLEIPHRGGRVAVCAAGDVRYLVTVSERVLQVIQVRGVMVRLASASALWPEFRPVAVACDARRVVLGPGAPESVGVPGAWQRFQFERSASGGPVAMPTMAATEVHAMRLTRMGMVAVVSNEGALRVLRYDDDQERWSTGAGLLTLSPTMMLRRRVEHVEMESDGDTVLVRVAGTSQERLPAPPQPSGEQTEAPPVRYGPAVPFVSAFVSTDGGRSFVSALGDEPARPVRAAPPRRPAQAPRTQ